MSYLVIGVVFYIKFLKPFYTSLRGNPKQSSLDSLDYFVATLLVMTIEMF